MSAFDQSPVSILQSLVSIPSVNPDGDPGTDQTGESSCAKWVRTFLKECGAEVWRDEVLPGRPNVIGRFFSEESAGEKPKFLFAPHTDTVGVGGMTIDPFGAEIRDGRLWGRGASDTKGTMAAMLWALAQVAKRDGGFENLGLNVGFVGLMGEETGQPGSIHFAEKYRGQWDFAIVGEPTELDVVHVSKGCVWAELTVHGKSAHGATPERGENAITKMLPLYEAIDNELRAELAEFTHPLLGSSTVNPGIIRGGTRTNIVPAECRLSLDFRETPSLHAAGGALGKLAVLLQKHGWSGEVEIKTTVDSEPLDTDPKHPFIKKLETLGSKTVGAPWFCDAARLASGDIPAVACGPGSIAQAHTEDEFLEIEKLRAGAEFYLSFLDSFS
ncbi:MAG: M20 family metallopeptidase [Verrucomicrobiales bacterium]|nr:M20 family metallopeptidase [Verrucomicrobiales bacterium]